MAERISVRADIYPLERKGILRRKQTAIIPSETIHCGLEEAIGYGKSFGDLGTFGIGSENGQLKLLMRAKQDVQVINKATKCMIDYKRGDEITEAVMGGPISIKSLTSGRRVVISLHNDPEADALVGAKPIAPAPTLETSVALELPR